MVYFQAGGNFQLAQENFFYQGARLRGPLEEGLHKGVGVSLAAGTAEYAHNFHNDLLEVMSNNMESNGIMSRRDGF
jgi:hypothetical protein